MKKFTVILATAAFGAIGFAPAAFAQDTGEPPTTPPLVATPELCAEADTAPPVCGDVTFDDDGNAIYPPVVEPPTTPPTTVPPPPATTIPPAVAPPTTVPPGVLPSTGSSGTSGFLQIGALLLTAGLLIVVAARRRTTANAAAA